MIGDNTVIFIQNGPSQVNEQIQVPATYPLKVYPLSHVNSFAIAFHDLDHVRQNESREYSSIPPCLILTPPTVSAYGQLKLKASVSKLRLSNASFLVYSLVDSLVNEMQLTLQHYLNLVSTASSL